MAVFIPKKLVHLKERLASLLSFTPPEGMTAADVQAAVEEVFAKTTFGGITVTSLTAAPRLVEFVWGDSVDGTEPTAENVVAPSATVQESIDALVAAGVPEANIRWIYLSEGDVVVVQDAGSTTGADNVSIFFSAGQVVVQDAGSTTGADNVDVTDAGAGVTVQDAGSVTGADNVLVLFSAGKVVVDDAGSTTGAGSAVIFFSAGQIVVADAGAETGADNVTVTDGEAAIGFTEPFTGANDSAPNAANFDTTALDADFTATIQSNKLRLAKGATTGMQEGFLPTTETYSGVRTFKFDGWAWDGTTHSFATYNSTDSGSQAETAYSVGFTGIKCLASGGNFIAVYAGYDDTAESQYIYLAKWNGATLTYESTDYDYFTAIAQIEIRVLSTTTADIYVNGVKVGATRTVPDLGAAFVFGPLVRTTNSVATNYFFDDGVVS